jgi:hypothetical protein
MQTLEPLPKIVAGAAPRSKSAVATDVHAHAEDSRWQLARRIAASGSLGRSRLLADFLLYIVDRHIRDRTDEITEQQIGILVFGRAEGYDANDDNIVRSYARNLRKRIDEYFATEGQAEPLRLEIPRGGYAPAFSARTLETKTSSDNPEVAPSLTENGTDDPSNLPETPAGSAGPIGFLHLAESPTRIETDRWPASGRAAVRKYGALLALCLGVALGVGCAVLWPLHLIKRTFPSSSEAASATLWTQLFSTDRDTFIVPSDDGLIIMQGITERPVPLASYVNGSYRTNAKADGVPGAAEILKLGTRRYTSVVDLDFVAHLAQLDQVVPARMMIRYARDLRMEDLRSGNAILIGSNEANPWIELFEPQMNFRFSINVNSDKPSGIVNTRPRAGENAIYGTPGNDHTFGLIAYVPNLTSTGHVLIVGGLNTAGTEAATTFLLTPSLMMPTLQRAKTDHGVLQPFELLIGAGNVATNASAPQLILDRIGAP